MTYDLLAAHDVLTAGTLVRMISWWKDESWRKDEVKEVMM